MIRSQCMRKIITVPFLVLGLVLQCGPEPTIKNTVFDLVAPLKLLPQGQCFWVGFDDGSNSLCCGRHRAPRPNVGLKIERPLDVRLALSVSFGRLRSEHITHNPLHMQSYIIWFHVVTTCQLFSWSIKSESTSLMEQYWLTENKLLYLCFCVLSPKWTNKKTLPEFRTSFTYWLQMSLILNDNQRNAHMASREKPTFGLSVCH